MHVYYNKALFVMACEWTSTFLLQQKFKNKEKKTHNIGNMESFPYLLVLWIRVAYYHATNNLA
jgi:hypothetical protein